MNKLLPLAACIALATAIAANAATEDDKVAARRAVLELAGAWANDGFRVRDGHWTGDLKPGEPRLIQVNLFAGNQYWFSLAANDRAGGVALTVFDEFGKPVATEPYADGARAAAGFSPRHSGSFFIQITGSKDGKPAAFSLVYSYK